MLKFRISSPITSVERHIHGRKVTLGRYGMIEFLFRKNVLKKAVIGRSVALFSVLVHFGELLVWKFTWHVRSFFLFPTTRWVIQENSFLTCACFFTFNSEEMFRGKCSKETIFAFWFTLLVCALKCSADQKKWSLGDRGQGLGNVEMDNWW